jgi:primosomal protein N' (replication factor Y)
MVADRYAGTLADVLRLAVPPRHARVESEPTTPIETRLDLPVDALLTGTPGQAGWSRHRGGEALLRRLADGQAPRAVWSALPGEDWPAVLAAAAAATASSGRGSLLLAPDVRDVARLDAVLTSLLGAGRHVVLTADLGPAARYRAFLAVSRGHVPIAVGTRAAAFAPVRDLGLVALWDDGDDLYAEPRAPYPHAREVLLLRAHHQQAAYLAASHARSVEAALLVATGWAAGISADRRTIRETAPQVHVTGETDHERERDVAADTARVPHRVFDVVRSALQLGPVLVHTPRYGYQPSLGCAGCRSPARCGRCRGPLARASAGGAAACRWCGEVAESWRCERCGEDRFRAPVVGALRTAEEWGRAFPSVPVSSSGGGNVLGTVPDRPSLVVATPGAEPPAEAGYAAAVLLDTWLSLGLPGFRAAEESLRRWFMIGSLVRPAAAGGRIIAVGDASAPALQALVRWDPDGFADRELAQRESARLTPAARLATITGSAERVAEALVGLQLPRGAELLGPVPIGGADEPLVRVVVRTSRERGAGLSNALRQLQAARSSRKLPPVRVQVDPADLV